MISLHPSFLTSFSLPQIIGKRLNSRREQITVSNGKGSWIKPTIFSVLLMSSKLICSNWKVTRSGTCLIFYCPSPITLSCDKFNLFVQMPVLFHTLLFQKNLSNFIIKVKSPANTQDFLSSYILLYTKPRQW